ncbi:hypothetical protein P691DRAFT_801952 [Macrolepiota fuliginosa MF-IS2]|uniref:Yeast cell wall synthesis Kre9/Knh1-like N-terminal domain-containing protein n=1 Tax=Macrolepiota fuliginosa MF-IS2 TaxID=1400762 RepID=A0A9P6C5N5_9AGAR|nr:hypothetical protein P691DRAFT_801952 [Macrolepiota fuliginosa MF-IS2]
MNAFMTFVFTIFTLVCVVFGAPVSPRDVFVPPLMSPAAGAVWKVGKTYEITWDTSKAPGQITNPVGRLILAHNSRLMNLEHPLAQGFSILAGKLNVTIPKNTAPGNKYQLVLMGDSGNYGATFSIVA